MNVSKDFNQLLQVKLDERKDNNSYRELVICNDKIDFSSNDYLGFTKLNVLKNSDINLNTGAAGSRLISGNSLEAEKAENTIASFYNAESSLIFNCGYMANVGVLSSIGSRGDTFITDEDIHASIIDGIRLTNANRLKFRHNDTIDLEKKLKLAKGNKFVVVESLYSMDGNEAPLIHIAELCSRYQALLIVDEAHATGVWGEYGKGFVNKYNIQNKVFACVNTFGKALGLHGAAVTGSKTLRNYLINFARPFIYSTALPPHTYKQIDEAYNLLPGINRQPLFDLINYFRKSAEEISSCRFIESHSQIQGLILGDNEKSKALSGHLFQKGIYAKAILSPTVSTGTERLRICLHTYNTPKEIDLLINEIKYFLG